MIKYLDIAIANETIKTTDIKGKDYAEVNQRIKAFRMVYPDGIIDTTMVSNENGVCVFKAQVGYYEDTYDGCVRWLGTGYAYEKENSSFINKTSYIENCETSAVGRALGMAGFGIDTSVASYEEVANAIQNQEVTKEEADAYTLTFGKYTGKTIKEVYEEDRQYLEWILGNRNDEKLLKIIELETGLKVPNGEEQNARLDLISGVLQLSDKVNIDIEEICDKFKVNSLSEMTTEQLTKCYQALKKKEVE